jgi:hypothetical protein
MLLRRLSDPHRELVRLQDLLRQLGVAQRGAAAAAMGNDSRPPPAGCAHSPDFRSVRWLGESYDFTAAQAVIVGMLWDAWERRTPDVGHETLLSGAGLETRRLADVFKGHPAWGTMIISGGTKGAARLSGPPD